MQFFYIQNRKMCFSKMILHQYVGQLLRWKIWKWKLSHSFFRIVTTQHYNNNQNKNRPWLFKLEKWNNIHPVS